MIIRSHYYGKIYLNMFRYDLTDAFTTELAENTENNPAFVMFTLRALRSRA